MCICVYIYIEHHVCYLNPNDYPRFLSPVAFNFFLGQRTVNFRTSVPSLLTQLTLRKRIPCNVLQPGSVEAVASLLDKHGSNSWAIHRVWENLGMGHNPGT